MSKDIFKEDVLKSHKKRQILRKLRDGGYAMSVVMLSAFAFSYITSPSQYVDVVQGAALQASLENIQITSSSSNRHISDIAADYRRNRETLADALVASGASSTAVEGLSNTEDYFAMLEHAGPNFLAAEVQHTRNGLKELTLRNQKGALTSQLDRAVMRFEMSRLDYYEALLNKSKN